MWNSSETRLDERPGYRVGVIPKPRVLTSGARDLARSIDHVQVERE